LIYSKRICARVRSVRVREIVEGKKKRKEKNWENWGGKETLCATGINSRKEREKRFVITRGKKKFCVFVRLFCR